MLTLLKNIERFNKRYNKKRGSAMLMVLMTMAIIIVVGSSMLFVTLSSFSNSIADTHQERAYNAALTVSDTLKNSGNLDSIITTYADKLEKSEDVVLKFSPTNELDGNQPVDYMIVNGVKVYVTLSRAKNTTKFDKVLVDVKGVKGSQESTVSFEVNSVPSVDSTTIKDTFGNSFVMSNDMGSEVTSPYQIYKRIEGDVSINCFENDADGKRVMKTRIFNPIVLEGVTGSIYANGDLIIGAPDNMLRVQGNIYVDGNLTIRGLALGVNLPALTKKYYAKKYMYYYTYVHQKIGSIVNPYSEATVQERNSKDTLLGEAMYEKLSDGTYRPIQAYDKLTHYTLLDLAGEDATEYSFWTKNYGEQSNGSFTWEQVTIKLRVEDSNGNLQVINAEYNQKGINNAQYLGASMYSDTDGDGTPIMQYPQGGNVYCSGDIVFDTVNYGDVFTYNAGIFNIGTTDNEQEKDEEVEPSTLEKLNKWLNDKFGKDYINPRLPYYSLAYSLDGNGNGFIPVHTKIEGDVYCQGRMIIAPDAKSNYVDYKKVDRLGISSDLSSLEKYINQKVFDKEDFVLKNHKSFLKQVKEKWEDLTGEDWGEAYDFGTVKLNIKYDRFNSHDRSPGNNTLSEKSDVMKSFITAYKSAYEEQKGANSESVQRLKKMFEKLADGGYADFVGDDYTQFGTKGNNLNGTFIPQGENKEVWYDFRKPSFSANSNLYIQNDPIRKGMGETEVEKSEIYATDDNLRVVTNTDKIKDEDRKESVVDGIAYTAALTVRYCEITVNNVYCNGAISVLESKLPGYENPAAVNVKEKYYGTDYVKNELKKVSIKELLLSEKNFNADKVLQDYFGITEDTNNFKGETDLVFDVKSEGNDDSAYNSQFTYKEKWTHNLLPKEDNVTHYRKVFVIRAHYETVFRWENDEEWEYSLVSGWSNKKAKHWYKGNPFNKSGFIADLVYCFEDKAESNVAGYENTHNNATGKIIERYLDEKDREYKYRVVEINKVSLKDDEENIVELLEKYRNGNKGGLNLDETAFIDFTTKPVDSKGNVYNDFQSYFKANVKWFNNVENFNDPNAMTDYKDEIVYVKGIYKHWSKGDMTLDGWYKSALITARYDFKLKKFAEITGGSELKYLDKLLYELPKDLILDSDFLNNKHLIAMFSNGSNDFGGINNGLIDRDRPAIIGGAPSNQGSFQSIREGVRAFDHKDSLYGMYLSIDKKYADVDKNAYVNAVFEEITSSEFATVVEANKDQDKAINSIKSMIKNFQDTGELEEYDSFDIYGSTNYDETKAGNVENYICRHGDQLTKKFVNISTNINNTIGSSSWFYFDTVKESSWFSFLNIRSYVYLSDSNEVENSSRLRLMDFYDSKKYLKDEKGNFILDENNNKIYNGPRLRADSTFAIDEKYNQTFTGLKDKELNGLKIAAQRSEVQYTINQNTYFNFYESHKEIIFAASTNDLDKRVRMNFLIDTSKKDIYIFFHCKAYDALRPEGSKEDYEKIRFLFQKCNFQVTGKNNAYLMLVDDTSFAANAFGLEISNTILSEDKTDEKVGTHFKSNTYQKYVAKFKGDGNGYSFWNLTQLSDAMQMQALTDGEPTEAGHMFIIGMGKNRVKFGRGGSVNALVYIPNGKYSNESTGFLNFIPIANSGNNEASIVAKDIYIGGSNRGQLIFTSYDASKTGNKNNSAGIVMDGLISPDSVTHSTKWVAGNYYYG